MIARLVIAFSIIFSLTLTSFAQKPDNQVRLGSSSVYLVPPEGFTGSPLYKGVVHNPSQSMITAWEEPANLYPMWAHSFTNRNAAKRITEEGGSRFIDLYEINIDGQAVPVMERTVESGGRKARIYEAVINDKNAIRLKATIGQESTLSKADVMAAFETASVRVDQPLDPYEDSDVHFKTTDAFQYFVTMGGDVNLMTFPGYDPDYEHPMIMITLDSIISIDQESFTSLDRVGQYFFPISTHFYGEDAEEPDHSKVRLVKQETLNIGPGEAYRLELSYEDRSGIQYIWEISENNYRILFAIGKTEKLFPLRDQVAAVAKSIRTK